MICFTHYSTPLLAKGLMWDGVRLSNALLDSIIIENL